jgi:hypothetical protein
MTAGEIRILCSPVRDADGSVAVNIVTVEALLDTCGMSVQRFSMVRSNELSPQSIRATE